MNNGKENVKSQIESLKKYRSLIYWTGSLSLIILIVSVIFRQVYSSETKALITEGADSVLFEFLIITSGAFFSSSLIGIIFERFQTRVVHDDTFLRERFIDEGIMRVFSSATDPELLSFIFNEIDKSRSEVLAFGMGLPILSHNPNIIHAIANKCMKETNFRFIAYIGDPNNNGIKNRISEEKSAFQINELNYDETWVSRYSSEIKSLFNSYIHDKYKNSYEVKVLKACPSITAIKIDNVFLYFSYGTPNMKGSQSPWILVDGEAENSALAKFIRSNFEYYASE